MLYIRIGSRPLSPQLHLELTNLLVQFSLDRRRVRSGRLAAVGEDLLRAGQEQLLPAVDQAGVDAELTGQLVDRSVRLEGGKGHPYSLTGGPVFGVHHRVRVWRPPAGPGVSGKL